MTDECIIPAGSAIGAALRAGVKSRRMIFVAGLPSSGKSLMLQQLTILAHQAGRRIHSMQWDGARRAFETPEWLAKYPEVNDLTHPGIRKAVGLWVREAVAGWDAANPDPADILIAELPVVGGRFTELMQPHEDAAEPLLAGEGAVFFVPVPSLERRQVITWFRAETFANPRNEQETKDAPIYIVENDWMAARQLHNAWTGTANDAERDAQYDPAIYRAVFERLARFRNLQILDVDQAFETKGSAYERSMPVSELRADADAVAAAYAALEAQFPGEKAERAADGWADY